MEKLEQEMNAPEKMAETPSPKKTAGKKKKFRKNQVIITALAIMIAVAGYINYADSTLSTKGDGRRNHRRHKHRIKRHLQP